VEEEKAGMEIGNKMGEFIRKRRNAGQQNKSEPFWEEGNLNYIKDCELPEHFGLSNYIENKFITTGYLFFKLLNFGVTFGQLLFLNWVIFQSNNFHFFLFFQYFLPDENDYFGFKLFSDLYAGIKWHKNGLFPRV
jgi:hypothetical protein